MNKKEEHFDPKGIKEVLEQITAQRQLQGGLQSTKVKEAWEKVMGKNVFSYTEEMRFEKGVLYIQLRSAPLRMELQYQIETCIENLNTHLEKALVKKIILH